MRDSHFGQFGQGDTWSNPFTLKIYIFNRYINYIYINIILYIFIIIYVYNI